MSLEELYNHKYTSRGSSFYVEWMRGTLLCDNPSLLLDINFILELNNLANIVVCIVVVVLTSVWSINQSINLTIYPSIYLCIQLTVALKWPYLLCKCTAEGFDKESEWLMQMAKVPKYTFLSWIWWKAHNNQGFVYRNSLSVNRLWWRNFRKKLDVVSSFVSALEDTWVLFRLFFQVLLLLSIGFTLRN